MIQLAHFIHAYLQLSGIQAEADTALPELEVVVPTGGAGNIAGRFSAAGGELLPQKSIFRAVSVDVLVLLFVITLLNAS